MVEEAVKVHEACLKEYWRQCLELPFEAIGDTETNAE